MMKNCCPYCRKHCVSLKDLNGHLQKFHRLQSGRIRAVSDVKGSEQQSIFGG
jgi:hypothetical protein